MLHLLEEEVKYNDELYYWHHFLIRPEIEVVVLLIEILVTVNITIIGDPAIFDRLYFYKALF